MQLPYPGLASKDDPWSSPGCFYCTDCQRGKDRDAHNDCERFCEREREQAYVIVLFNADECRHQ